MFHWLDMFSYHLQEEGNHSNSHSAQYYPQDAGLDHRSKSNNIIRNKNLHNMSIHLESGKELLGMG